MKNNFLDKTIKEIRTDLEGGEIGCGELVDFFYKKLEEGEKKKNLNAVVFTDRKLIEQRVKIVEKEIKEGVKKDLIGIPVLVKDNIVSKEYPTTAASKMLFDYRSPYSATVIDRLEDSGAIIVGKTNLDEFAMGSSGENSVYGPTKNPWDFDRVAGGSSSGSTVGVAAGYCLGAYGSDTGGSIRQPASFCGVTGLKPTYGRVSRYGLLALGSSLDQIGPIARNAEDAALLLKVIAGYDEKDSTSSREKVEEYDVEVEKNVRGMKIGLVKEFFEQVDDGLKRLLDEAVKKLVELGVVVEELSLPTMKYGLPVYYIIQSSECSANLARYDGVRYGGRDFEERDLTSMADMVTKIRSDGFGREVKRRIMLGTYSLSSGYYDQYFDKAAKVRTLIINEFKKAFSDFDLLIGLTSPSVAFAIGEKMADPLQMYLADIMTVPISLAGLPAISIPIGLENKLPVGMQIIGKWFDESSVLKLAGNYQKVTSWHKNLPYI
ncbi:MAG: Asp-tRNA(Asn)/Glu-tRNA(Gln) amidotransferase subunit GatA [Patescibacteria group bacterium]